MRPATELLAELRSMLGTGEGPGDFSKRLRSIETRVTSAAASPVVRPCVVDVVRRLEAWSVAAHFGGPEAEGLFLVVARDLRRLETAVASVDWGDPGARA